MILFVIALLISASEQNTIRCFSGGYKIFGAWSNKSLSDICLKDDVSQFKIMVYHQKNSSGIFAYNEAWRKWTTQDWYDCNPKKTELGPISVLNIDAEMSLTSTSFACTRDCMISLDKDNAEVVLTSSGLNHFEIAGTTINSGWFKTSATIKLDQTCEHVKVTCGPKSLQLHACFKNHMACIRFLHKTILPATMATSICQNIELILMTTFALIIFCILILLMKTYICYLLMPIFIPVAYIYGFIYDRACKKCQLCGLVYHPFTKCGSHCVCGMRFEGSESMKKHRDQGNCPGYKFTSTARCLCKSKGSAFSLSIILAFLALGFITPIQGLVLLEDKQSIPLANLPEKYQAMQNQINIEDVKARTGGTTDMFFANFNQTLTHPQLGCVTPKEMWCISPRTRVTSQRMLVCTYGGKLQLVESSYDFYKAGGSQTNTYCAADTHCIMQYRLSTQDKLIQVFKDRCYSKPYIQPTNYLTTGIAKCKVMARGACKRFKDITQKTILCQDGNYYPDKDGVMPLGPFDPEEVCLSKPCGAVVYPFLKESITNCTWDNPRLVPTRVKEINHQDFEHYKQSLMQKLQNDMTINNFHLTKNLPHFIPQYKYLTIQGVETTDGIDNAYIKLEIPALTGTATGISVSTPNGQHLFDLIVYIKISKIQSTYNFQYYTGKTIGINTIHTEKCTGTCPKDIEHKSGWATFSKERSSNWGCEEFGCLAIETGCVYGSCQDIIKREYEIYSKSEDDKTITEVCISMTDKTFCGTVDATTPIITPDLELQYKTVETTTLPKNIVMSNHKLFKGQINDRGSFGKYCGNYQVYKNQTLGQADVKFDYICHAASRKDIVIRKCFNNDAQSCAVLTEDKDLIFEELDNTVTVHNNKKITGTIAVKAILGDFSYKLFAQELTADFEASCIGCYNCIAGITCNIKIKSEIGAICNLDSPCSTFTNRILIQPGETTHAIKLKCSKPFETNDLTFKLCKSSITAHLTQTKAHDNLQLSTGEQSTYIHEEDLRCQTWICKVQEEGLSFILKPLVDWLGSFTWPIATLLIVIVCLFIAVYIFMPMCMKLKDLLKKNEYEHMQEIKAIYSKSQNGDPKVKILDDRIKILANKPLA
ncbi:polyprotein [Koongol virus]|uniref:Envelopment polyprotein n=1 Tax=Koongol virus TaxID=35314 RepID=A0A0R7FK42_9VIRU|nr:polyprotein [Koongol virus]AKO90176.1 polyprotein [Koongol virus]